MKIINILTGDFYITDKLIIERFKNYNDILKIAPTNETLDIKNGYKWIYFKEIEIDNLFFNIGICFHNDRLFCIDFGFTFEQQKNLTWENWNEENELIRKDIYEKWLTINIGKKRKFNWGTIGAYYDPRGGTTSINIKYR
jgi:hypothetical protein